MKTRHLTHLDILRCNGEARTSRHLTVDKMSTDQCGHLDIMTSHGMHKSATHGANLFYLPRHAIWRILFTSSIEKFDLLSGRIVGVICPDMQFGKVARFPRSSRPGLAGEREPTVGIPAMGRKFAHRMRCQDVQICRWTSYRP